jgi:SAM-dependent methyltransferase
MTPDERWLASMWPKIERALPRPPAAVVDLGCGRLGGFVPRLRAAGYDAVGVDPEAPEGPDYCRVTFEESRLSQRPQAVVASTSLHHVQDPGHTLSEIAARLTPGGLVIVVEWDWEHFDESTVRWCFERLDPSAEHDWLSHHHDRWLESGQPWDVYVRDWAAQEGLHPPGALLRELDARFDRVLSGIGPYFFPHLRDVTETDEQAAIDAGSIRAGRIDYVGRVRS